MKTNKFLKSFKLGFIIMAALLALVLVQTTSAYASGTFEAKGKCTHQYYGDDNDGHATFSVKDLNLKSDNVLNSGSVGGGYDAISQINDTTGDEEHLKPIVNYDKGNDSAYHFNSKTYTGDEDEIYCLGLVCESRKISNSEYGALAVTYKTATDDFRHYTYFHFKGSINMNGQYKWRIDHWFRDGHDQSGVDSSWIWKMKQDEIINECGCTMQEAIQKGILEVCLDTMECRAYYDDNWVRFDTSHLKLDKSSVKMKDVGSLKNGRTNKTGDGKHYDFNDDGRTYDIYDLNLQAFTYSHSRPSDNMEQIRLCYNINTPDDDWNGEDFKANFTIFIDGTEWKTITCEEFTDFTDSYKAEPIWSYSSDKFRSQFGCSLSDGIASGRIEIVLNYLDCDPC